MTLSISSMMEEDEVLEVHYKTPGDIVACTKCGLVCGYTKSFIDSAMKEVNCSKCGTAFKKNAVAVKKPKPKAKRQPIKYKAVSISIKQNSGILVLPATHLCGNKLLCCVTCNRCFCPECDVLPPKTTSQCCHSAFDARLKDSGEKNIKRQEIKKELAKRVKHGRVKYKVSIAEIENGNKL